MASVGFLGRHIWTVFSKPTIDDAAISYAYAANVAAGNGFRHTPGASPSEGFSNPLEVILLVPFAALHANLDVATKAINLGFVLLALLAWGLFLIWRIRGVGCLLVPLLGLLPLLWPTFNYWTVAGLENGILAGLMALSILCLLLAPCSRGWDLALALVAGLVAWTRPEAGLYGALAVAPRLLSGRRRFFASTVFALVFLFLLVFRHLCFRDFVPNTFWPKMGAGHAWQEGWYYAQSFLSGWGRAYFFCLIPLFALLSRRTWTPLTATVLQIGAVGFFLCVSGGDWMRQWRFMQFLEGPAIALAALGLYAALVPEGWLSRRVPVLLRMGLVAGLSLPLLFANRPLGQWKQRAVGVNGNRDVDMRKIAICAGLYRELGTSLQLGRRLLEADIDVGGMSYPLGMDVLDMAGLTDLELGRAWNLEPTILVDYLYGERRPDTFHMHGSWLAGEPVYFLWPFHDQYRVMGPKFLSRLALAPLSAVRADLVDPAAPPMMPMAARVGAVEIKGISAILGRNETVFFVHGLQVQPAPPPVLAWKDQNGKRWPIAWHAGFDVGSGPPGSALLGVARMQNQVFPLHIDGVLELESLPLFIPRATTLTEVARLPLVRLAGVAAPECDPDLLLDPGAGTGARARGAVMLASLCGDGFTQPARTSLAARFWDEAKGIRDPDERFDAIAAISALGIAPSIRQRMFIEQARTEHQPYDEILMAWAERELTSALATHATASRGLALWLQARQYDKVLLSSLAHGWQSDPAAAEIICSAARALGLRQSALEWTLGCGQPVHGKIAIRRQEFENPRDQSLHFSGTGKSWIRSAAPIRILGGQGRQLLATGADPGRAGVSGEVVWGPIPWSGRRFGALLAGTAKGATLLIDAKEGSTWKELARAGTPASDSLLTPLLLMLPAHAATDVRVRLVATDSQPMTAVDALTFIDME